MLDVLRDEVAQSELVLFWYKILDLVLVMVFLPKAYDIWILVSVMLPKVDSLVLVFG